MPNFSTDQLTFLLAILTHAIATVWWASKTNTTITFIREELSRIRVELEKRDTQIAAIWNKIDRMEDRMTKREIQA